MIQTLRSYRGMGGKQISLNMINNSKQKSEREYQKININEMR